MAGVVMRGAAARAATARTAAPQKVRCPQPEGAGEQAAEQGPEGDGAEPDQADGPDHPAHQPVGDDGLAQRQRVTFHAPHTAPVAA